jgi:hypothetical protein
MDNLHSQPYLARFEGSIATNMKLMVKYLDTFKMQALHSIDAQE